MGRKPCCWRSGLRKGAWSLNEDHILTNYITNHGALNWRDLPRKAGLERCGKSCRLRWLNYLKPDIKRGSISVDEEDLIIKLHSLLGNKWSLIAGRLPGRTDNEIKNHWNCKLRKRAKNNDGHKIVTSTHDRNHDDDHEVVRPRAVRCTKVINVPHNDRRREDDRTAAPTGEVNVTQVPNPLYHHHDTDQNRDDPDPTMMFDLDDSYGDFFLNTNDHDHHSSTNQSQDDHDSILSFDIDLNGYGDLMNITNDQHSTSQNQDDGDKMLTLDLADGDYDNLLLTINDHNHLDLWINSLEEDLILHESSDIGA